MLEHVNDMSVSSTLSLSGSDSYPERRGVRKGNTVYVYGSGLTEESLRSAFSQHGNIIDLSMDNPRKYGPIKQLCTQRSCLLTVRQSAASVVFVVYVVICASCSLF